MNGPLQRGLAAADAVFGLIDAPVERDGGRVLESRVHGRVDFISVGFTYPGQKRQALREIELHVEPGETVAFVGMSGGGKSTLVNLIAGFYAPTRG